MKLNPQGVRVLAIIPARGGSRGIPKKNIAEVAGHPLIYYTLREAHRSTRIDATIVSTDSEEIASVTRELGGEVPFLRPSELAGDQSRDNEVLLHALEWARKEKGWQPEIIAYLLPTTPTRTAEDIDAALEYMERSGADSVRTMIPTGHFNPYKMWKVSGSNGKVEPLFPVGRNTPPRQSLEETYLPVAALYATRPRFIEEGRVWGDDVRMVAFPPERFVDIDEPADLTRAEELLRRFNLL